MESVWDPSYMHKSHEARDRRRAECTHSWSRLSTFPIHWGSAKKKKTKTTKRNTDELQMVSERKVAVPLLLSLHPKQESWRRCKSCFQLQCGYWLRCSWEGRQLDSRKGCACNSHCHWSPVISRRGFLSFCQLFYFVRTVQVKQAEAFFHYFLGALPLLLWLTASTLRRTARDTDSGKIHLGEVFPGTRTLHLKLCLNLNT